MRKRLLVVAAMVLVAGLAAAPAEAGVHVSLGFGFPVFAPAYAYPPPVVVAPPPPVYYAPPPVYYGPPPYYYRGGYYGRGYWRGPYRGWRGGYYR